MVQASIIGSGTQAGGIVFMEAEVKPVGTPSRNSGSRRALSSDAQPIPPELPSASDAGDSLPGFGLHTNAKHRFVIELRMLEQSHPNFNGRLQR